MRRYRKFIILYVVVTALIIAPFGLNLLFIHRARENLTYTEIAKLQHQRNALYGTAMNQNTFSYKLALVRHVRPNIIALGSSTILTLREEFFNKPFINCGSAMNSLTEGNLFLKEMLKFHKPDIVIVGLDFWWFSDGFKEPVKFDYHENIGSQVTFEKLTSPFRYLYKSRISKDDYIKTVFLGSRDNSLTKYETIGLRAMKNSDGFRKDGSVFSGSILFGLSHGEIGVNPSLAVDSHRRFEYGNEISERKTGLLRDIIAILERNNINFVILIPSVSTSMYNFYRSDPVRFGYIDRFREYVHSLPYEVYDYHDISECRSNDCELLDDLHAGEVTYLRMLLTATAKNPSSVLKRYLEIGRLQKTVLEFSGKRLVVFESDKGKFNYQESGCKKILTGNSHSWR